MRLLVFGGLLVLCSPGVLLGWGFSVGMVAGCAISYALWWVNGCGAASASATWRRSRLGGKS
jgi:hypothetical protein